jgi:hypothetical protein
MISIRGLCIGLAWYALLSGCSSSQTATTHGNKVHYLERATRPDQIQSQFGIEDIHCYVWVDHMPGAPSPDSASGSPLYVALRITPGTNGIHDDSLRFGPLTLWYEHGDSMLATLTLTTIDGLQAWLQSHEHDPVEFTNDRTVPVRALLGPEELLIPHLRITGTTDTGAIRLPALAVERVY